MNASSAAPPVLSDGAAAGLASLRASIRRNLTTAAISLALLLLGFGVWAATAEFAGAVIAEGQVVVDSNVKKVQHPTGGVVGQLNVRDGDHVKEGDVLLRLDETMLRSNLVILKNAADQLAARGARLDAEGAGAEAMTFPQALLDRRSDPAVGLLMSNEENLFAVRLKARQGLKAQLLERIGQLKQEVEGIKGQVRAKDAEVELITSELTGVKSLYDRNLVPYQRVTRLERDAAGLAGERSALVAASAQADGKITETQLQILQVDQDSRSEAARDLRDVQGKLQELLERQVAAQDQLNRTDLRAPQDGVVYQLAVHSVGGVINAAEPVMLIVPTQDRLTVQAKISPRDIDRVAVGQPATLRFTSFDQRTTPEVEAEIIRVSPDLTVDTRSGSGYYVADIAIPGSTPVKLVPGMPAEVFVKTDSRTVLSFLVKPLLDQVKRAFRDG